MPQISIVKLSDVQKAKRFDSEYFKPEYLEIERKLRGVGSQYFGDVLMRITGGATPLGAEYSRKGIPFLRVQNIMQNYFNDDLVYISKSQNKEIERSTLKTHDVLLTITGVYGKSAIVEQRYDKANINQHSVVMRFKNGLNPYYVSTFLNCKYGKKQSDRNIVGLSRPALDYQRIKKYFLIPLLSQAFQNEIEHLVKQAHEAQSQSKQLYEHAETTLLEELGLVGYEPQHRLSFQTTKREVEKAKRFDAEYFQPKYDEIIKKIEEYKGGFDTMNNVGYFNNGSFISDKYYSNIKGDFYIRIKELSFNHPLEKEKMVYIDNSFIRTNETTVKENDFVFATIGNTIGKVNLIDKDFEGSFPSNNTSRFRLKKIVNPYFYELLFRNFIFQNQVQRYLTQTAQPKISNEQLGQIKIPLITPSIQEAIAENITESHRLRKQSKDLLNMARQAVEIAIEDGEETSRRFVHAHALNKTPFPNNI